MSKGLAPNWSWLIVVTIVVILIGVDQLLLKEKKENKNEAFTTMAEARVAQIYPNYTFEKGVNQIKVPLIPMSRLNPRLPNEAGGWVKPPNGARVRFDHDILVVWENIDGRRELIRPEDEAWLKVEPGNASARYYGEEGKFVTVSIKRNFYN